MNALANFQIQKMTVEFCNRIQNKVSAGVGYDPAKGPPGKGGPEGPWPPPPGKGQVGAPPEGWPGWFWQISAKFCSFSPVLAPIFASKYAFFSTL